jgi:hypothetical protein
MGGIFHIELWIGILAGWIEMINLSMAPFLPTCCP